MNRGGPVLGNRGKLAAQITDTAERIGSDVTALLGLTVLAVVLAAGALLVSMRALSSARH